MTAASNTELQAAKLVYMFSYLPRGSNGGDMEVGEMLGGQGWWEPSRVQGR